LGFSRKRIGRDGKARYTAYYQDARGLVLSAGTYSSKDESDDKWQDAEAKVREGRGSALVRGKQNFELYVRDKWFPSHRLELRSRETYTYYLDKHIIPWFKHMRLIEIMPDDVREFVADLERQGVKASSIGYCLTILGAIFTAALNSQAVFFHPCRGVSAPTVAKKIRQIITPEQYDILHQALADEKWQLLVELDIETGLRWGELTELRPKDFAFEIRRVTVSRAVVEVPTRFHPTGTGRFVVKEYPKDEEHRAVSFSAELMAKIEAFVAERGIGNDDLIFARPPMAEKPPRLQLVPDRDSLPPIMSGGVATKYKHGTISGYSGAMKCRCDECKGAYADYRYDRRRKDKDRPVRPRQRVADADDHIPRRWFRNMVWLPARDAAKLGEGVKVHSLRHAHASWLLAGGADIARVKERLGHSSILTTQKYIHTLPDLENDAALDAFSKIRNRSRPSPSAANEPKARGL
jgi:integrase